MENFQINNLFYINVLCVCLLIIVESNKYQKAMKLKTSDSFSGSYLTIFPPQLIRNLTKYKPEKKTLI